MDRAEIDVGVREVVASVLRTEVPPDLNLSADDDSRWDSLKHIEIMFSLEDRFGIQFREEQLAELRSISLIVDAIESLHGS